MKDELIQQLRLLGMGRIDAAQAIADILMPESMTLPELMERVADSATVVLGADLLAPAGLSTFSSSMSAVTDGKKIEGEMPVFEAPWPPETPVKPKRKKV